MADIHKEISSFVIFFLLLIFADHVTLENSTSNLNWTKCVSSDKHSCHCSSDVMTDVIVRCQITNVSYLDTVINSADRVKRLNLSGNRIQRLNTGSFLRFTKMIFLSLASNGIHMISQGAFDGLTQLLQIDLSDNNIKHWNTSAIDKQLSNLRLLIFEKNKFLNPDHGILSLSRLQVIYVLFTSLHYTSYHIGCYLVRNNTMLDNEFYEWNPTAKSEISYQIIKTENPNEILSKLSENHCIQPKILFGDSSFFNLSGSYGFRFECEVLNGYKGKRLRFKQPTISDGWKFYIKVENKCWSMIGLIHIMTSSAGILSLVFNLFVVMTTLRIRVLRESVAHVLVANIAIGDLLVSLYLIILVSTRQIMSSRQGFYEFSLPYFCRFVGILLLIGQFSSSMLSFVMTLERYLAVVYCMRPHIRITIGTCQVAMAIVWGLSFSLAVSFMTSEQFSKYPDIMCVPQASINGTETMVIVGGIGVLFYILSIALYGHMYLDFRRTNHKTVQLQRENRLARKMALIVFTNVFFIILPLGITAMIGFPPLKNYISDKEKFIIWNTMAVTSLGVNSFLNPVLFSFRNKKFRTEFRKLLSRCNNSVDIQSD